MKYTQNEIRQLLQGKWKSEELNVSFEIQNDRIVGGTHISYVSWIETDRWQIALPNIRLGASFIHTLNEKEMIIYDYDMQPMPPFNPVNLKTNEFNEPLRILRFVRLGA